MAKSLSVSAWTKISALLNPLALHSDSLNEGEIRCYRHLQYPETRCYQESFSGLLGFPHGNCQQVLSEIEHPNFGRSTTQHPIACITMIEPKQKRAKLKSISKRSDHQSQNAPSAMGTVFQRLHGLLTFGAIFFACGLVSLVSFCTCVAFPKFIGVEPVTESNILLWIGLGFLSASAPTLLLGSLRLKFTEPERTEGASVINCGIAS